jgi:hypothetical protein
LQAWLPFSPSCRCCGGHRRRPGVAANHQHARPSGQPTTTPPPTTPPQCSAHQAGSVQQGRKSHLPASVRLVAREAATLKGRQRRPVAHRSAFRVAPHTIRRRAVRSVPRSALKRHSLGRAVQARHARDKPGAPFNIPRGEAPGFPAAIPFRIPRRGQGAKAPTTRKLPSAAPVIPKPLGKFSLRYASTASASLRSALLRFVTAVRCGQLRFAPLFN